MSEYSQRVRFRLLGISRELEYLPDEAQQREAYQTVARARDDWRWWVPYIGFPVVLGALMPLLVRRLSSALQIWTVMPQWVFETIVGVTTGLTIGYGWVRLSRRRFQRAFWKHLCSIGVPTCLHCGYDLRGQTEPRCPECGRSFASELQDAP